jgi:1-acyl-sn-glycerol-3-phosphate acyltransferase
MTWKLFELDEEVRERIEKIPKKNLNDFGVDAFGYDPQTIKDVAPFMVWLYRHYFRCEVTGIENVPEGRMLVIANHSGQLPFDGLMIAAAFLLEGKHPRALRGMAERWSAELPFISTLFVRGGAVVGEVNSCVQLLNMDEAVIVFPEGVKGISKLFNERYKLLRFGHGFMRIALKTKTPIVPVALIGAEEQAPSIANIKPLAKMFGLPAMPLIFPHIVPFPLPVKYRIHIGKPMYFSGDENEETSVVSSYVGEVKAQIQDMLDAGVRARHSIFF